MIALNAFVCSGRDEVYEKALARCEEDAPVLGWGCEAEDKLTLPSSRWGLFQTATNWCHNLPVFASDVMAESIPVNRLRQPHPLHWSALDWGDVRFKDCRGAYSPSPNRPGSRIGPAVS
jgi:hypothetical protein